MKNLKNFTINFASLSDGQHQFQYELDAKFLENFEGSPLQDTKSEVKVQLTKQTGLLTLDFELEGTIPAVCDLCAEEFDLPIFAEETVLVKFVTEVPETDFSEIIYLEHGTSSINIAQQLYEMLVLSIPIRKVHPEANGKSACNADTLRYLSNQQSPKKDGPSIWDALKNIQ